MTTPMMIVAGMAAGIILALVHLATLERTALWMSKGRAGPAIALQFARFAGLALVLLALARLGPAVLVAAVGALIVTRAAMVRRMAARLT